jgi:uncharacterized protein YejL (UPF0352 family)
MKECALIQGHTVQVARRTRVIRVQHGKNHISKLMKQLVNFIYEPKQNKTAYLSQIKAGQLLGELINTKVASNQTLVLAIDFRGS